MTCSNRGFTLVELLVVVAVIGIIAAIAVPALVRARMSSNEGSAIAALRAVAAGQASYAGAAARGSYATSLATLAEPCPNSSVGFISPDLATDPSIKAGFQIALEEGADSVEGEPDCNGTATGTTFYGTAVPLSTGISGHRAFAVTAGGTIFFALGTTAPTEEDMAPGGDGQTIQ